MIAKCKKHYIFFIKGAELHLTALKKYTSFNKEYCFEHSAPSLNAHVSSAFASGVIIYNKNRWYFFPLKNKIVKLTNKI